MPDEVYRAADVAAELRRRLPGIGAKKLHKLLYYCQGHHLADIRHPLFMNPSQRGTWGQSLVSCGSKSNRIAAPGDDDRSARSGGAEHDRIPVASRYGALTGEGLGDLVAWRAAMAARTCTRSINR